MRNKEEKGIASDRLKPFAAETGVSAKADTQPQAPSERLKPFGTNDDFPPFGSIKGL
jgi:hypothetical protein